MRAVGVLIESYDEQAGHCPYAWVHGRSLTLYVYMQAYLFIHVYSFNHPYK